MRILVVDDDADITVLLEKILTAWGHDVTVVHDGSQAWELLQSESISFVISDWMMPQLNGLELCRRIRQANFARYVYVILLTAKDSKNDLIEGMEAGADDFVIKPFNKGELKSRIRAGERILQLERDLEERNRKLSDAYKRIQKDLQAAAQMQKNLLPARATSLANIRFDWLFLPSALVAGDIFNFFKVDDTRIGFYVLDVAGHGIPSAMLSVTLSKMLSPENVRNGHAKPGTPDAATSEEISPAQIIAQLNERFYCEDDVMYHFTMVYGVVDRHTYTVRLGQAGHPPPILYSPQKGARLVGRGGLPVGMFLDSEFEEECFELHSGDRMLIYSDGVTETINAQREQFSVERLRNFVEKHGTLSLRELLDTLKEELVRWTGNREFEDDITVLALEAHFE